MSSNTDIRLTSGQRLGRGLKYTAVGPVDVTRGALGVGLHSVASSAAWVGNRYRRGHAAKQLREDLAAAQEHIATEFAAAQEVVSNLPSALQEARSRAPSPAAAAAHHGRSTGAGRGSGGLLDHPSVDAAEPSPLPPSVEVTPKP